MRTQRANALLAAVAALAVCSTLSTAARAAQKTSPLAEPAVPAELAQTAELEALHLSMVDRKLALSLAIEMYLQIALTDDCVGRIQNEELKRLTQRKVQLYRSVFAALDRLTEGRAISVLTAAGHQVVVGPAAESSAHNAPAEGGQSTLVANADNKAAADPAGAEAAEVEEGPTRRKRAGGGLRGVLSQVSETALLQARLDIAGQYEELWHADLELVLPAEFDRRYLSTEGVNQMQVVAMLRVCEQRASDKFAEIIHRATAIAEEQLAECQQLARRIDDATAVSAAGPARVTVAQ
ncbi:MAG: hypothetical protein AB7O59_24730 [Pirellulales bacterium]